MYQQQYTRLGLKEESEGEEKDKGEGEGEGKAGNSRRLKT
jgi:hypothetical protein